MPPVIYTTERYDLSKNKVIYTTERYDPSKNKVISQQPSRQNETVYQNLELGPGICNI